MIIVNGLISIYWKWFVIWFAEFD